MPRLTSCTTALTAVALLALPGVAAAAPSWSSPIQVVTPSGDTGAAYGTPEAFLTPQGGSLLLAGTDAGPQLIAGTAAGAFGKPTALAGGPALGATGDLGGDGTFAATWSTDGTAKVAIVRPGQAPAVSDLSAASARDVAVAVGSDGTVTAAWRTKSAGGVYTVEAAQAAPGTTSFGPAATLSSTKAATDFVEVDAGAGGAAVVVFRAGSPYRVHAAVKPAGGAFPAGPQALSSNAQADLTPQVEFDAGGTAVAAWSNPGAGAQAAFLRPGATAFEPAVGLSPAGEPAYSLDLSATPQGGVAAAWDAGGPIRVAVQADGAGFGPADQVLARTGAITAMPAVSVDAGGTPHVIAGDPQSGAVQVAAPGQPARTIGYGKPSSAIATDVAAGAGGQAVAVWQDAEGGLTAATRGEAVTPGAAGPTPAAVDRKGPVLQIGKARTIRLTRKTTKLTFTVSTDEPSTLLVTGTLRTTVKGKRKVAPLTGITKRPLERGTQRVTVKLNPLVLTDLRRAFKAKRNARLLLTFSATDEGGYETRLKPAFTLKLRR